MENVMDQGSMALYLHGQLPAIGLLKQSNSCAPRLSPPQPLNQNHRQALDFWPERLRHQSARTGNSVKLHQSGRQSQARTALTRPATSLPDKLAGEARVDLLSQLPATETAAGTLRSDRLHPLEQQFDSRHRSISSYLDCLLDLLRREPERDLTEDIDHLLNVMTGHFDKENEAMKQVDFPQTLLHSLRHQAICFGTAKLRYRFSKGQAVSHEEVNFIRLLWQEHLEEHDAAFERFLAA